MLIPIILFVFGFVLLIKGGDWFVDGAAGIAHKFGIPEIIIGATIVSIGTTLPEVMVSATSAVTGHSQIAYGNAIGSIICNTALISALTIAIMPSKVDKKTFIVPVSFFFGAAFVYSIVSYITGYFSVYIGITLLLIFVIYMIFSIINSLKNTNEITKVDDNITPKNNNYNLKDRIIKLFLGKTEDLEVKLYENIILLVIGAALIAWGADLLVDNGTIIAKQLGVPESVIALTFVALGTSLPEFVTAITSLIKGHGSLSLGNIVGANLFNLVLVSGLSITLKPFNIPADKMIFGMNASLVIDLPVMILVMALMTIPPLLCGKLKRWQGISLLCIYVGYCAFQFIV